MVEGGTFNINSQTIPTNKDLLVSFSPSTDTNNYNYTIYKDGKILETIEVSDKSTSDINLTETGKYQIIVNCYNKNGESTVTNSGIYIIDKVAPVIKADNSYIEVHKGDSLAIDKLGLKATDNYDGEISTRITTKQTKLDNMGVNNVIFTVSDSAGNVAETNMNINVVANFNSLLVLQIIVIACLIILAIPVLKIRKHFKIEKRLDPFVIESLKGQPVSVFDRLFNIYHVINERLVKILNYSAICKKYAKKLDKYVNVSVIHNSGMEILAGKCLISMIFVAIAICSTILQFSMISIYEIVLPLIVGFFLFDILYFVKYRIFRAKLENDLLSAIIIMNNAFKSGRSVSQAIDIVGNEMEGAIGKEFKKMSLELSYGLEIDVIFKRFAERVNLEEINYLTASLTILNKTGGNIIKVFAAIEKNLFNKKKLRLELKSLTGSSKIIIIVLLSVPFLFVLLISLINPTYFMPFITTKLGIIMLIGMIIYYIIFIIFVRKIMRVVI